MNDEDQQTFMKVDKRDENKVIAYIQALSQVILNVVSGNTQNQDQSFRITAATMSVFSEYLLNSSLKIMSAATAAVKLIISYGLSKLPLGP